MERQNFPGDDFSVDEQSSQEQNNKQQPKKSSRFKPFISGFLGGILAILLFLLLIQYEGIPLFSSFNQPVSPKTETETIPTKVTKSKEAADLSEVTKSVVGVLNLQQRSLWEQGQMAGTGSGIVYKIEGDRAYIVTNNHVIENANNVEVELYDETRIKAKVIGSDALTDLAVLEVDSKEIQHVAEFGSSSSLTIGEDVIAIGNPLSLNLAGSVTRGIISGLDRSVPIDTNGDRMPDWINEVIQTDAAINPGNSGGALVNLNGEVIGINSMKIAQQEVEGIGFAIPSDAALPIIEELETNGEVERPFIGIQMVDLATIPLEQYNKLNIPKDIENGVIVAGVEVRSPADEAGIEEYDIITKIDDEPVESYLDLRKYLYTDVQAGDELNLEIYRNGKKINTTLKLTKLEG